MNASTTCPRCGSVRVEGACPRCLLDAALAEPEAEARPEAVEFPRRVGRHQLLGEIARGGTGVVYRAWQPELKREVALKMLLATRLERADALGRFRREAELMASLDDPGILPVYEVGEHEGLPYFSMKLAEGGNLAERVASLSGNYVQIARMLARVARAVDHAHRHGVLHRDLKPSNIVFDAKQQPLVTDFGLARHLGADSSLTGIDALIGTPRYVAPEVVTSPGSALTPAVDVYGLGAILYELLTGVAPFAELTPLQVLREVATRAPIPPRQHDASIPPALEAICLRCLEKRPGDRFAGAAEFARALESFAHGGALAQRLHAWLAVPSRRRRAALAAMLLLGVALGSLGTWWWLREPFPAPDPAVATRTVAVLPSMQDPSAAEVEAARRLAAQLRLTLPLRLAPFAAALATAQAFPRRTDSEIHAAIGAFLVVTVVQEDDGRFAVEAVDDLRGDRLFRATYARGEEAMVARELGLALEKRRTQPTAEAGMSRRALTSLLVGIHYMQSTAEGGNTKAIAALKDAIARAPDSALAHAWLAWAYIAHGGENYWLDSAIDEAATARRMDPDLGFATWQLGKAYYYKSWFARAMEAFEDARAHGCVRVESELSLLYYEIGRFADSYRLGRERRRFDADAWMTQATPAHALLAVGMEAAGASALRTAWSGNGNPQKMTLREAELALYRGDAELCSRLATGIDPAIRDGFFAASTLARTCATQTGDIATALATIEATRRSYASDRGASNGNPPALHEAILLAQLGRNERLPALLAEARPGLQAAIDAGSEYPPVQLRMAALQRLADEIDPAYATLERAFALGLTVNYRTRWNLEFLPFKDDARFAALRARSEAAVADQARLIREQIKAASESKAQAGL
ncbi:MAG: serine/threonine protein kinase [Proteobacteria bacterium]|nr:serine/threonine protein kinase [Pseudomonadota bacterium]